MPTLRNSEIDNHIMLSTVKVSTHAHKDECVTIAVIYGNVCFAYWHLR